MNGLKAPPQKPSRRLDLIAIALGVVAVWVLYVNIARGELPEIQQSSMAQEFMLRVFGRVLTVTGWTRFCESALFAGSIGAMLVGVYRNAHFRRTHLQAKLFWLVLLQCLFALVVLPSYSLGDTHHLGAEYLQGPRSDDADDSWGAMLSALSYTERRDEDGSPLYQEVFFADKTKYLYPPTALLTLDVLVRLASDPIRAALIISWLFILVNALFVSLLLFRSMRNTAGSPLAEDKTPYLVVGTLLTLTFYPIMRGHELGQIQVWINAMLAGALWCWMAGREKTSGVLTAVACLIKPTYAPLLIWAALRRRWNFLGAALATGVAGVVCSLLLFGWADHIDYISALSFMSQRGEAFSPNQSMNGVLNRLLHTAPVFAFEKNSWPAYNPIVHGGTLLFSALLLGGWLAFTAKRGGRPGPMEFGLGLLTVTMASPIAWEHHYGILLPIFALLIPRIFREDSPPKTALLIAAFLLTANLIRPAEAAANWPYGLSVLQSYLFFGALIVLALLYRQVKRESETTSRPSLKTDDSGSAIDPEAAVGRSRIRESSYHFGTD